MLKILSLFFLVAVMTGAQAGTVLDSTGKPDRALVAKFVAMASPVIGSYPPRFAKPEDRELFVSVTREAADELGAADLGAIRDQQLLADIASVFSMGHNLDLGTGKKAKQAYERALALDPESRATNYRFGMFLIGTRSFHFDSLPYLQKALALGEQEALYPIGLLMVHSGKTADGLSLLESYVASRTDKEHVAHARMMIQGIKDGKLQFQSN